MQIEKTRSTQNAQKNHFFSRDEIAQIQGLDDNGAFARASHLYRTFKVIASTPDASVCDRSPPRASAS
jgi:hypothetical protein